ncbi:NAD(+) synthase [Aureivirga sp. CE67]|uniref:NAD(+) synthase n=1 Tax=Aureivirga sp. CE67 TaxID=1788983 RepID=UPI0018C9CFFE|nr:NAD(+) synthase [Aureivirga sp. CE67]
MNSEKIVDHIVSWLKNYAEKTGVRGFVVGISGGIDSAVTSTLCARTGFETLCVEMPIHQELSQVNRAKEHIEYLKSTYPNVSSVQADLTETFETFKKAMPIAESSPILDLTLANTRARIRMTTLYYFAGMHSSLVAGTGNKVEDFGVGFYTKYGDGGVDISPIADLMKSEVFALASFLNVPMSIQSAKPTDGLFGDDRSDEDQIGATYDELEWAMKADENGKTFEDFEGREKEVFQIYKQRNNANKHKMNPIPVCLIPEEYK